MTFDPSQPRDEDGKWSETGSIVSRDMPEAKASEIKAALIEAQRADTSGLEYGLRVLPPDSPPVKVGDVLDPSGHWEDGHHTGKSLDGTSVIGAKDPDRAIADLKAGGYYGHKVVVVRGEGVRSGDDVGERILDNPEVVSVIELKK